MKPKYIADSNDLPDITDERDLQNNIQITYCGFCRQGNHTTADSVWKIIRYQATLSPAGTLTLRQFPDGSILYNKTWDNREKYNYKFHL
jgi:hypothetical protein